MNLSFNPGFKSAVVAEGGLDALLNQCRRLVLVPRRHQLKACFTEPAHRTARGTDSFATGRALCAEKRKAKSEKRKTKDRVFDEAEQIAQAEPATRT
ncbi:hypothetical protein, partial [Caballeronia calidae]|uniref:hypothetical protein n=1 Tax=Caballeronia calidae TaxID=1777139 RepID=UPI001E601AFB